MSMINEALKKAAQQRSQAQPVIHPVQSAQTAARIPSAPAKKTIAMAPIYAGILIAALLAGLAALYLLKIQETERRVTAEYQLGETRTQLQKSQDSVKRLEIERSEMINAFQTERAAMSNEISGLAAHLDAVSAELAAVQSRYDAQRRLVASLTKKLYDIRRSLGF